MPNGLDRTFGWIITLNGQQRVVLADSLTYDQIAWAVKIEPKRQPTIVYRKRTGEDGILIRGQHVLLIDGMVFTVMMTDSA